MEESNKNLVDSLQHLLSIARDGEKGYKNAAENAKDEDLKTIFARYSQQRSEYATELKSLIATLGGDTDEDGGMAGALHRTWIDIKESLSGHDRHALLSSCETGEDAAKDAYTTFFGDNFEYHGGSTASPYTVTGGTNRNYESTGLDTGNGSDTSSSGYSNTGSSDRKANLSQTDSDYASSSDYSNTEGTDRKSELDRPSAGSTAGTSANDFQTTGGHSSTMSDMDMDMDARKTNLDPNTNNIEGRSDYTTQRANLKDPESELDHKVYNTVRMQLEGIQHAHDTIKSLRDQSAS